jgi:D-beta-D-heptose 7-phosphate kinase/D-beta-D-heptose 1-phosphate adenosyltransferase
MHSLSELLDLVDRLSEASVTCIGDLMLDRFIYGEVERVSPEAPVPVLRVANETDMLGGAGNVVRNLAALNARSALAAVVGDDEAGHRTESLLRELPHCRPFLIVEPGRGTTIKTRCIGGNQQILRVDREQYDAIASETTEALLANLKEGLTTTRTCVLSDYGKGVLTAELTRAVIELAHESGCRVVIDPKGTDYERYRGADVITPNREELAVATGMAVREEPDLVRAAQQLRERYAIGAVVVTRSEEGLSVIEADAVHHLPAETQEVYDVSGAGDTVVATLAAACAVDMPLAIAAQLANVAAGIAVSKLGTAVTEARELQASLRQKQLLDFEGKVLDRQQACRVTQSWQADGLVVGFTNGCFDLIHPGHVALLENARKACDRLVVGLNSDASTRRLKGPQRPVQNEAARATVLASMSSVDLVVTFAEDTPLSLLEALRPDALFKGADYKLDAVVGADLVRGYGGRVELIDIVPEQSTTRIVDRLSSV